MFLPNNHLTTHATGLALAITLISLRPLTAQDGSLDTSFQSPEFSIPISMVAVEANGSVLYSYAPDGLHFTIGRLTSSGAPETSISIGDGPESITPPIDFGTIHIPGATNPATINVLLPLSSGKILVGGGFSHFNKTARKLLVRLNSDGTVDGSFNQGSGFEGDFVNSLVIGPDDKIYAGGKFTKFNNSSRGVSLIRLNANGSFDSSFADSSIPPFGAASVGGFSLQPDGKVLVDAAYANASFQATLQVYRLGAQGGLDSQFAQGTGTPATGGLRHGLMANGQILVAGGSGVYNGGNVTKELFRLNSNGEVDAGYQSLALALSNIGGTIGRFLRAPDGRIYIIGAFDHVAGHTLNGLARLHADGSLDTSFVPQAFVSPIAGALALQPDGKLLVGASVISGASVKYVISRLNGTGGSAPQGPQIGPMKLLPGNTVQMQVSGNASQAVVQGSSNLLDWGDISTNAIVNGSLSFSDPHIAVALVRFYRLQALP